MLLLTSTLCISSELGHGRELKGAQLLRAALLGLSILLARHQLHISLSTIPKSSWANIFYFAFLVFAALSSIWSCAPLGTAGKALELLTAFGITHGISQHENSTIFLQRLWRVSFGFAITLLSIILAGSILLPGLFHKTSIVGGITFLSAGPIPFSENAISRIGALCSVHFLARFLFQTSKRPSIDILSSVYCAAFPFLALGRTGIAALLIAAATLFTRKRPIYVVFLPLALLLAAPLAPKMQNYLARGQSQEMLVSLTGRTDWWAAGVESIKRNPALGAGFGYGGQSALSESGEELASSLHNGLLEVLAGVGFIGTILWAPPIFLLFKNACIAIIKAQNIEYAICIIPLSLATILSVGAGGWLSIETALVLLLLQIVPRQRLFSLRITQ